MPMSTSFKDRLFPVLKDIVNHFGTPFHLYDEKGIQETGKSLINAFSMIDIFREYYAVKALPNPSILKILKNLGQNHKFLFPQQRPIFRLMDKHLFLY